MTNPDDPFLHHPELRDMIVDPLQSHYREITLEWLDEKMRAAGARENWRLSDEERETTRQDKMRGKLQDDLWVFAYGSLMWDPGFRFAEVRCALLPGYHRSFCLRSELGRGTPERPGMMAGLVEGGTCRGLAFRIAAPLVEAETRVLWKREMLMHAYEPTFVPVETAPGTVEALTFVINPAGRNFQPGMSVEETARYMAQGEGLYGTSLAYLENLAEHFESMGIEDEALFELLHQTRKCAGG